MPETAEALDPDEVTSVEDEKFDRIYPVQIRELSSVFWTPVAIAAEAAKLLVTTPGTHVLDIGCGPGKFCLVAASLTKAASPESNNATIWSQPRWQRRLS